MRRNSRTSTRISKTYKNALMTNSVRSILISASFHSPFQGVKESDTGLASPNLWDLLADRQRMGEDHSLQVARCTKIIPVDPKLAEAAKAVNPLGAVQGQKGADEQDKYVINIKQIAKFVVGLGDRVAPTDIEEGMRVG